MPRAKYSQDLVRTKIEHRGGMLVSQLFDWLPEEDRPSRKYFVEFLRKIKGVSLMKYDMSENCLFVTTAHGMKIGKKRLLIMVEAIEQHTGKPIAWFKEVRQLTEVYRAFMKHNNRNWTYFDKALNWMDYYNKHQQQTLKMRNAKSNNSQTIDYSETEKTISMNDAPEKPSISLLNLHRRNIFLELRRKTDGQIWLCAHVLDSDDNLTKEKLISITNTVLEFMAYHSIGIDWYVVIYTWNSRKKELYKNRLTVPKSKVVRDSDKLHRFKNEIWDDHFNGFRYIDLNISRHFNKDGLDYWNNDCNRKLLRKEDPEILTRNQKIKSSQKRRTHAS